MSLGFHSTRHVLGTGRQIAQVAINVRVTLCVCASVTSLVKFKVSDARQLRNNASHCRGFRDILLRSAILFGAANLAAMFLGYPQFHCFSKMVIVKISIQNLVFINP